MWSKTRQIVFLFLSLWKNHETAVKMFVMYDFYLESQCQWMIMCELNLKIFLCVGEEVVRCENNLLFGYSMNQMKSVDKEWLLDDQHNL